MAGAAARHPAVVRDPRLLGGCRGRQRHRARGIGALPRDEGAGGLGGGARYVGVSYGDTANAYRVPGYTLYDLFLRKAFASGIVLSVNARNLTNHRYVALCSSASSCFYGSGRTLNLRLQYRW